MAKKPVRARTVRRTQERHFAGIVRDQERLARREPGGAPDRPVELTSASLVELDARDRPCPLCGGKVRVEEHAASAGLREVLVLCTQCGVRRTRYYRIVAPN